MGSLIVPKKFAGFMPMDVIYWFLTQIASLRCLLISRKLENERSKSRVLPFLLFDLFKCQSHDPPSLHPHRFHRSGVNLRLRLSRGREREIEEAGN